MEEELQIKIFGHYEEMPPPKGSYKEALYDLVSKARLAVDTGQANEKWFDETIEQLAATQARLRANIQNTIIAPSIERQSKLN